MKLAALVLAMFLQAPAPPIGMVLSVEGNVTIQHAGKSSPALIATVVYPDDRVSAGPNGKVTLTYCPTNQKLTLASGSSITLGAAAFRSAGGAAPQAAAFKCTLPQMALGSEKIQQVGAVRTRGDPPATIYTGGALSDAHPVFKWEPVEGATTYRLVISDENDKRVSSVENKAPLSEWRGEALTLAVGKSYQWELTALANGKPVARQTAMFEIKPNAELAAVPSDGAARLQHAVLLENAGYFAEAADIFRQLRAANPSDARFTQHLIWLYQKADLTEAENRERRR